MVRSLTYSPPGRRTAREIALTHRNRNEGHVDLTPLSPGPPMARDLEAAHRLLPGLPGLGSPGYVADRYACTVRMRIPGTAGSLRSLVKKTGHFVRSAVASWRASGVLTECTARR